MLSPYTRLLVKTDGIVKVSRYSATVDDGYFEKQPIRDNVIRKEITKIFGPIIIPINLTTCRFICTRNIHSLIQNVPYKENAGQTVMKIETDRKTFYLHWTDGIGLFRVSEDISFLQL